MSNREDLRINQKISILIDYFIKDTATNNYNPVSLICEGLDVSAGGLKIHVDRELPLQAIYQAVLTTTMDEFCLAVQTKWIQCLDASRPEYSIGLQILASDETDIIRWKKWVAEQLDKEDFDISL
ncbi:MAG: hypothetical protein KAG18_05490 [Sinobacterium sp.]|nr:hypothetical protein [Sinobacterium sp.]